MFTFNCVNAIRSLSKSCLLLPVLSCYAPFKYLSIQRFFSVPWFLIKPDFNCSNSISRALLWCYIINSICWLLIANDFWIGSIICTRLIFYSAFLKEKLMEENSNVISNYALRNTKRSTNLMFLIDLSFQFLTAFHLSLTYCDR